VAGVSGINGRGKLTGFGAFNGFGGAEIGVGFTGGTTCFGGVTPNGLGIEGASVGMAFGGAGITGFGAI
jgi:hypothetical protein